MSYTHRNDFVQKEVGLQLINLIYIAIKCNLSIATKITFSYCTLYSYQLMEICKSSPKQPNLKEEMGLGIHHWISEIIQDHIDCIELSVFI